MQGDLRLNLYSDIDLKNESNTSEILQIFDRFFFAFGGFAAFNELAIVPTSDVPSFVQSNNVISPSELYKRYNSGNTRRLVCILFLAALNVHLGGDKMISKNAMYEIFHNLSMQALSKSDDTFVIKFDAINILNQILNELLTAKALTFDTPRVCRMMTNFNQSIFVSDEHTDNKRIENSIVRNVLNDEKMGFPTDTDHISMP